MFPRSFSIPLLFSSAISKTAIIFSVLTILVSVVGSSANAKDLLLVTNKGDRTLSLIDPVSHEQIATIAEEGVTGHEVATSVDGHTAYVPIYGDSGVGKPGSDGQMIRFIDLKKRKISGTIDLNRGLRPHCAVMNARTGLLYVTIENDNAVEVIDPRELQVLGQIPTGKPQSHMLAVTKDGLLGYTANVSTGTVSVLDLEHRKLLQVIDVCHMTQRISLSVDDKWVFTSDQLYPQLAIIDAAKREVTGWIPLPASGYGTAPTPDGKYLVVAMPQANKVAVVDLQSHAVVHVLDAPKAPQEVLVRPDGKYAYVSCDASKQVIAIRTSDWKVEKQIDVGTGADGLAWAETK